MLFFRARTHVEALLAVALLTLGLAGAQTANAVPALQLDIVGGYYDQETETIIASGNRFTLLALATPTGNTSAAEILGETYFLSAAILPPVAEDSNFNMGSFEIDGMTISATSPPMIFGTPPTEDTADPDLPGHGIFDSYYYEIAFNFSAADTIATYNSQDDAGAGLFDETGADTFFVAFEIDISNLLAGRVLHFDLYNTKVKKNGAVTIDDFAPFSHDAQSSPPIDSDEEPPVADAPEPATMAVLLTGLGLAFRLRHRRSAR